MSKCKSHMVSKGKGPKGTDIKEEWSSLDSIGSMHLGELDWARHERAWVQRRDDAGAGPSGASGSPQFIPVEGESYEDAIQRMHREVRARYEQEYAVREQRAFAMAKEQRERELMSQYGREIRDGVAAGQHREQERSQAQYQQEMAAGQQQYQQELAAGQQQERERLQAEYAAELQRAADAQRGELQAQHDRELDEERARVQREVGHQHNEAMEGMHNEQWQQEHAWYLQQIGEGHQFRRQHGRDLFQQHLGQQQHLEQERVQWHEQRQLLEQQHAQLQQQVQVQQVQLQQV